MSANRLEEQMRKPKNKDLCIGLDCIAERDPDKARAIAKIALADEDSRKPKCILRSSLGILLSVMMIAVVGVAVVALLAGEDSQAFAIASWLTVPPCIIAGFWYIFAPAFARVD